DSRVINHMLSVKPPIGPLPAVFQDVRGYVAGYDKYLHDVGGSSGIPDPRCRGAAWVRPITANEVWRRFYQPILLAGENVASAALYGVPAINIGHTATMAWSHTVSTAFRFTPYQLTLAPGDPTAYVFDNKTIPMDPRHVTVWARQKNGSIAKVTKTLWWT